MTKTDAEKLVLEYIKSKNKNLKNTDLIIIDNATIEDDFGWMFFYNSKVFVETGNIMFALGGNAPIIFDKDSSEIVLTGTRLDPEIYLKLYKELRHDLFTFKTACTNYPN
ncbi:YrhB domain-containing protein [Edaphocola flava]|uniref:YrhB domain-containing protein n=1 Tax=Edaphocola flava TaxID=2499629 RepID=UPI00100A8200|nr:YrhB domain-containing protein [Edaphocola flava]